MTVYHIAMYASIVFFLIFILARGIRIAKAPLHLRWELYPVPHEKGRAAHGGSILEEVDWWTKPRENDHFGEISVMAAEILLLKAIWEHNRSLWWGSFPLHFGFYLLIGNIALLILASILQLAGVGEVAVLFLLIQVVAWAGCILGVIGSIVMLFKRMFDPDLNINSNASHYVNLLAMGAIFGTGLWMLLTVPDFAKVMTGFYSAMITKVSVPYSLQIAGKAHLASVLFFLVYLPFTHMTHFFTKYFTYHVVRWEDEPNTPDSPMVKKIEAQLNQKVSWSAPHIQGNGTKTWVDIATSTGVEEKE